MGHQPVPDWAPNLLLLVEVWTLTPDPKVTRTARVAILDFYNDLNELKVAARLAAQGLDAQFNVMAPVAARDAQGQTYEARLVARREADQVAVWSLSPLMRVPERLPALLAAQGVAEAAGRVETGQERGGTGYTGEVHWTPRGGPRP